MRQAGTGLFRAGIVGDAARSGVLMRKCACGTHAPAECDDCKRNRMQRKAIAIGPSEGPMEDEADRAATAVMGGHGAHIAGGQPLRLSRAPDAGPSAGGDGHAPAAVDATLRSPGQPLDATTRAFMEPRFGHDFSHVRVHADAPAADSARSVGALAYTVGSDVVFGAGHYQPGGSTGRALLAHELAHVVQQQGGGLLQRAPDPAAVADFNKRFDALKLKTEYAALGSAPKRELEEIAEIARKRDNIAYYATKLELLFATPEEPPAAQAAATRQETNDAASAESTRLGTAVGKAQKDKEKNAGAKPGRLYTPTPGDGATFGLDARDVTDVAVRAKVRLTKKGSGNDTDVLQVKSLQDAIEKRSNTFGYTLELEFVTTSGSDVFEAGVDTAKWTVANNWVGSDIKIAHELHHRLGLKEDRYDYIESHTKNRGMPIPTRIHWFRTELTKVIDNTKLSIMNTGLSLPQDDDVCMIAGKKTKPDVEACVKTRSEARQKKLDPALKQAIDRARKAAAALATPAAVAAPQGGSGGNAGASGSSAAKPAVDKQALALNIAKQVFGKAAPLATLTAPIAALPPQLVFNNLYLVNLLTPGCDTRAAVPSPTAPRIRLCPSFLDLSMGAQSSALLGEALHAAGIGSVGTDAACAKPGCGDACGTDANATAWVRLVECSANL